MCCPPIDASSLLQAIGSRSGVSAIDPTTRPVGILFVCGGVMRDVGVEVSRQMSKALALVPKDKVDIVVALCDGDTDS